VTAPFVSRAPVPTRRAAPLVAAPATAATCPVCQEGAFRATWLKTTVLLVCNLGCPGRRIAVALGLDGWPEVRS
jgi:hypothetical protein